MKEYYLYGRRSFKRPPEDALDGLVRIERAKALRYCDEFVYDRKLSNKKCRQFGMEFIKAVRE